MLLSRLRLVTFDITGTLLKFKLTPGQQYGEISALYGINCDGNELSKHFKEHWHRMSLVHPNFGRDTGLGWEEWWRTLVKKTFKDTRANVDEKKLDEVAFHLIELYKVSTCWQLCDGVSGLLSYIRSKNIPMGVISNFDPRLHVTLTNIKLRHFFHFILTSYEAGFEKPDPKIFQEAMARSKLEGLKPEECLHIGDQVCYDYIGAKNSGWQAVIISDTEISSLKKNNPEIEPSHVFDSLFGLHKHFIQTSKEDIFSQKL
ncbi:unnamed protein product [Phyllotreta striolata]|uniref:Rhythmically expressed gene 2 protein n=1 Tax=Phyllotreta striolata TaxID=444603 RepID=A0A9N9XK98_PHYSR|nr:unnamed protein product [Phyllotreta striolata]